MIILLYYDIQRNLWISRHLVEGSNWNKRIPTLYRCLFVPETKNRKSNLDDFMIILCYYDIQRNLWISRHSVEGSNWNKRIPTLNRCLFVPETKNRKSNFMMILFSEIFEYLGTRLKVPTEINGFLFSIISSLYQKQNIENHILWWICDNFMLLWYSAKFVNISALGWSFQLK